MMQAAASTTAGLLGMAIFISLFAGVVYTLLRKGAADEARHNAMIPFEEK